MDENLGVLETRAATGWQRYGKIAAIAGAAAVSAGVGLIVWRKTRRTTWRGRLDRLSPDALRALADEVGARLKKPLPSVTVRINEQNRVPGLLQTILRKVAPAVVGTAATGLASRVTQRPAEEEA